MFHIKQNLSTCKSLCTYYTNSTDRADLTTLSKSRTPITVLATYMKIIIGAILPINWG